MSEVDVTDRDLDQMVGRHLRTRSEQLTLGPADLAGVELRRDRRRRRHQWTGGLAAAAALLVGGAAYLGNDKGDDRLIHTADDPATDDAGLDLSMTALGRTSRAVTSQPVSTFDRFWALGPTGAELIVSGDGVHWDLAGRPLRDAGIHPGPSGIQLATDGETLVLVGVSSDGAARAATVSHDGQIDVTQDITPPLGTETRLTLFGLADGFAVGIEAPTEAGRVLTDAEERLHQLAGKIADYESLATSHADPPGDTRVTLRAVDGSVLHETTMSELGLTANEAAVLAAQTADAPSGLTKAEAFISADGRKWSEVDLPESVEEDSSFVRADGAIALHPGGNSLVASKDGKNWSTASFPQSSDVEPIANPRELVVTRSSAWLLTGVPGYLLSADDMSGPYTTTGIEGRSLSFTDIGGTVAVVYADDNNDTPSRPRIALVDADASRAELELPASEEQRSWFLVPLSDQSFLAVQTGESGQVRLVNASG